MITGVLSGSLVLSTFSRRIFLESDEHGLCCFQQDFHNWALNVKGEHCIIVHTLYSLSQCTCAGPSIRAMCKPESSYVLNKC